MTGKLALVLSGGGAKGAFQVGVLDELITNRGLKVDTVVGVSTGALQALGVAQKDVPRLLAEWLAIKGNSDIYKKRLLGAVGGFLGSDAIYNTKALRRLIERVTDEARLKASGIRMLAGVANLGTGEFKTINEQTPRIHEWIYASCAMPLFFDPYETVDASGIKHQWVDGGVRDVTPLSAALKLKPDAVLVVRASPQPKVGPPRTFPNLIKIGLRAVDILQAEVSANDTEVAGLINDLLVARDAQKAAVAAAGVSGPAADAILEPLQDKIDKYNFAPIHVIEPDVEFTDTLEFDPARIRTAIAAGRKAAADHFPAIASMLS
ncbi:MAG TPA: patatin-like phospholipase family protein [Allosphingosinicella sp.]|jgi:NTE family protein